MKTLELQPQQWKLELDHFSRTHQGQRTTVQSGSREFGVQANARNLPLVGVTVETERDEPEIEIVVGDSPGVSVDHVIRHPVKVRVAEWNDHISGALRIDSADGTMTILQAGPPEEMLPPGFITDGAELGRILTSQSR